MENENKKFELNDNEIEKVIGGCASLGSDVCEEGLKYPSLSVCPNKCCGYYCANYRETPDCTIPFCDYFCVRVD